MTPGKICAGAAIALGAVLFGGCATTSGGMGGGELDRTGLAPEPVLISWTSGNDGISGEMVATLPDSTYSGRFFEITRDVERTTLDPLWVGWPLGWAEWADTRFSPFDPVAVDEFVTRYSGRVVANLKDANGGLMRCRLSLSAAPRGMAGGGTGECQIRGSAPIQVSF